MEDLRDKRSPGDLHNTSGTVYTRSSGNQIPAQYGNPAAEYAALKEGAAIVDRSERIVLRLVGKDPVGMLDAVLTNEVPKEMNLGAYAMLLNAKGRIQTDLRVLKANGDVLIDTEPEGAEAAREILGRYAPFSRVKLEDLSAESSWMILGLYGPRAGELLNGLRLAEHESAEIEVGGQSLLASGVAVPVPGFDLLGTADALQSTREHLIRQKRAVPAGLDAYETARVEAGIPRFGSDITPENFPAEAGLLERAVSFRKGCYPGQETVARMYYRGHPNRTLYRLVVEGPLPLPNTPIVQNEKQVGRITSTAPLPVGGGRRLALGYLSRNTDPDGQLQAGEAAVTPVGTGKDA
jgi:tRNA-modifying protein YgfZ